MQELKLPALTISTSTSVIEEKQIGPYGRDGKLLPAAENGMPVTDYEVRIESVLKGDGSVATGGTLILRMFGQLSAEDAVVTLNIVQLPKPGSRFLFALGRNPDGTYGSGNEGLIQVDAEAITYSDGVPFPTNLTGDEFVRAVTKEANRQNAASTVSSDS